MGSKHSLKLSQPGVCYECSQDGRQVAQSNEGVVDGCGKVVIPAQEVLEIQNEHSCRENKIAGYKPALRTGSSRLRETQGVGRTSHAIVGEPLAELIDDDEEDAQGVAKAARLETRDRQRELGAVQHGLTRCAVTCCSTEIHTAPAGAAGCPGVRKLHGKLNPDQFPPPLPCPRALHTSHLPFAWHP